MPCLLRSTEKHTPTGAPDATIIAAPEHHRTGMPPASNQWAKAWVDVRVATTMQRRTAPPEVFAYLGDDPAPPGAETFVGSLDGTLPGGGLGAGIGHATTRRRSID
jgi:hypothetical protein